MPMPAPPCASGTSSPMTPRSPSPARPRRVVPRRRRRAGPARTGEIGACSARKRRTVSRSSSWSRANSKSIGGRSRTADVDVCVRLGRLACSAPCDCSTATPKRRFRAELRRLARRATCPSREVLAEPKQLERRPARLGAGVAAHAVRRRLARARAGRPSSAAATRRRAADDLLRGDVAPRDPAQPQPAGPRHHRPVDPRLRHARAAASGSSSRRCGPRSRGASA